MDSLQGLWELSHNFFTALRWQDVLDVVLVSFVFYKLFSFVKETRAAHLIRGFLLLFIIYFIANTFLELRILTSVLQNAATLVIVAIPVVFQPELRRALSELGRGLSLFQSERLKGKELFGVINILLNTVQEMSENRTGALIVIERQLGLNEYFESGYPVDGEVSKELLLTIFHEGTPMHDGAVILRGNRLMAAGVVLPLIETLKSPSGIYWGTRHRAALGISDVSDAACIVVSEETGSISLVERGKIHRNLGEETLERKLLEIYQMQSSEQKQVSQALWNWLPLRKPAPSPAAIPTQTPGTGLFSSIMRRFSDHVLLNLRFIAIVITIIWGLAIGLGTESTAPPRLDLELHSKELLLPIQIENPSAEIQTEFQPRQVNLTVSGKSETLKNLDLSQFKVYLELKDLQTPRQILPVAVSLPPDIQFKDIKPRTAEVRLYREKTRSLPGPHPSPSP